MNRIELIMNLINAKVENDHVDFKREYYHNTKKYELLKDIISFSNSLETGEKYVIFGVDDESRDVIGIEKSTIPDISEINQLVETYCDPFIFIDIENLKYQEKDIAVIVIKNNNFDCPYTIRKEYVINGKKLLTAGDIYVRKGANNFRALRTDLENIYNNREKMDLSSREEKIFFRTITHARKKDNFCCIPILIINNSNVNYAIGRAALRWLYPGTATGSDILYIEDDVSFFNKELTPIVKVPFDIRAKSQYQKMVFLKVSDDFCQVIKTNELLGQKPRIIIEIFDTRNKKFSVDFSINSVIWEV